MAHSYGMNERQWKEAIAPVKPATLIGPPAGSNKPIQPPPYRDPGYIDQFADQMHPYTFQHYLHIQSYEP